MWMMSSLSGGEEILEKLKIWCLVCANFRRIEETVMWDVEDGEV